MRNLISKIMVAAIALAVTSPAEALVQIAFRQGATDLDFRFEDNSCTDARTKAFGSGAISPYPGGANTPSFDGPPTCANGVVRVNFKNGQNADASFVVFQNLFYSTDPALGGWKGDTVKIKSAWWTPWNEGEYPIFGQLVLGVPEPSTWAYLMMGFGLVGYAARRSRAGGRSSLGVPSVIGLR